jgi:hypothetical protein
MIAACLSDLWGAPIGPAGVAGAALRESVSARRRPTGSESLPGAPGRG